MRRFVMAAEFLNAQARGVTLWLLLSISWLGALSAHGAVGPSPDPPNAVGSPRVPEARYSIRHWTPADGLPSNRIQCLLQSKDGYVWIGTQGGLVRFDGVQFKLVSPINCRCLVEDRSGVVWIGSQQGLFRMGPEGFERCAVSGPDGEAWHPYSLLCPRRGGGVWASLGSGAVVGLGENPTQEAGRAPPFSASALVEDTSGKIWRGDGHGTIQRFEPGPQQWRNPASTSGRKLPASCFFEDSKGLVWCGGGEGLVAMDRSDGAVWDIQGGLAARLRCLTEDAAGSIWAGTDSGLWQVRGNQLSSPPQLESTGFGAVTVLLAGGEGNLWVGTDKEGLFLLSTLRARMIGVAEGLAQEDTWSIIQARDDSVWVATHGGVSHLSGGSAQNYKMGSGLATTVANCVLEDNDGRIWVATEAPDPFVGGGVSVFEDGRFVSHGKKEGTVSVDFYSLAVCPEGGLWVVGGNGVERLRGERFSPVAFPPEGPRVAFVDREKSLWIGSTEVARLQHGQVERFTAANGLGPGLHAVVKEDESGAYWLVSEREGVVRFKDGKFKAITTAMGFFSNLTLTLEEDDFGRYWFNSHNGVFWARKQDLNDVADGKKPRLECVHYGLADGMLKVEGNGGNWPNSCKTRDGRLWFPTTQGVAVFDPKEAATDGIPASVLVEEVLAEGEVVFSNAPDFGAVTDRAGKAPGPSRWAKPHSTGPIRLAAGRGHSIVVHYTAAAFASSDKVRFRHRLRGRNEEWTEAGAQHSAHLENLAPGPHRFQVTACNAHGVWNPAGAEFSFLIEPYFYQTWTFYTLSGAGLLSGLGGLQTYRRRVNQRIARLEREAALAQERERISRDLHDDLGASLSRIALLSEVARRGGESEDGFAQIDKISSISRGLVESMGELVWATNPKYDDLESLNAYLREFAGQFFSTIHIQLAWQAPEAMPQFKITAEIRREVFLIFKEALNNIAKHAAAKKVEVRLRPSDTSLTLEIADDGVGLAPAKEGKLHHGLDNMRARVAKLWGQITIAPGRASGVLITVVVPFEPKASKA